ncbi:hypothetical protein JTE90_023878 [Oedothorax gibbosus]|uniref:Uncharacterized protein n=1 Tax=Oedothorax gibbosus TaxID=931172 RepID=A0AAV6ULC1_9ARAC|nr:hypothetical protein JTE90_023878 [Oedothorax gibbosus]
MSHPKPAYQIPHPHPDSTTCPHLAKRHGTFPRFECLTSNYRSTYPIPGLSICSRCLMFCPLRSRHLYSCDMRLHPFQSRLLQALLFAFAVSMSGD